MTDATLERISVAREGGVFRLGFKYSPRLVELVKKMPDAQFDPVTKTWTSTVCTQSLEKLRELRWEGLLATDPDDLVPAGEQLTTIKSAHLRAGTVRRPFLVHIAMRDDELYRQLVSIPGARWEKAAGAVSYPPHAAVALADLCASGVVEDSAKILQPAEIVVAYDARIGAFTVRGDTRAADVFAEKFPAHDVVGKWLEKGHDVAFADDFSREIYHGERARLGEGFQPDGMLLDLYPYQRTDLAVALARTGLGVWSSMGVGKTAVGIALGHQLLYNDKSVSRVVVLVPPSVRTQWRNEIIRFTGCPESDVVVVDGDKKKRMAQYEAAKSAKWLIVHYQAVILADDTKKIGDLISGSVLICDEAHRLKNEQAKTHKVVKQYSQRASRRLLLSGTPVENQPGEWYNLINLVYPGVFGSPIDFLNRYAYPGKFGGYEGARNIPELRKRSKVLYVRHTLNEKAEFLPKLRVQTIKLDPKPEYQAVLKRAHKEARDEIRAKRVSEMEDRQKRSGVATLDGYERDDVEAGAEMTAVGMLKLLCCSPRIVTGSESQSAIALVESGLIPDEDGPKVEALRTMCAEMQSNGERLVVFTSSKRMANLVAERLTEDGVRHVLYTGDTSTTDRDLAVAAFTTAGDEKNPGPTAFVSTDAGAEGLNLGRCCSTLINLDIPWTPGRLAQRNARVRRVDSTATSFLIVNLVIAGTIEEGILRMVEHKADLADAILGENDGRMQTTGRGGRNVFEAAMAEWEREQEQK